MWRGVGFAVRTLLKAAGCEQCLAYESKKAPRTLAPGILGSTKATAVGGGEWNELAFKVDGA